MRYETKDYANVVLRNSMVTFHGEEEDAAFFHLSLCFGYIRRFSIGEESHWFFFVFHSSSRSAAFHFLIFVSTMLSSFWVNCPTLVSTWLLMIFVIGLSVAWGEFLRWFLKYSFHICICSSRLAVFSLALVLIFLLLIALTFCRTIQDCLSSIEFLIL